MRMVRVRGGGVGRCVRGGGGRVRGPGGGSARLGGRRVRRRGVHGRKTRENRPCFGRKSAGFRQQHTLRCLVGCCYTSDTFRNTSLTLEIDFI